ncbi:hypothetical protein CHU98_g4952 [Xylaria longipes]|nr:hypothetical protein CHU98_g4952 [Xylaria longipes]
MPKVRVLTCAVLSTSSIGDRERRREVGILVPTPWHSLRKRPATTYGNVRHDPTVTNGMAKPYIEMQVDEDNAIHRQAKLAGCP